MARLAPHDMMGGAASNAYNHFGGNKGRHMFSSAWEERNQNSETESFSTDWMPFNPNYSP